MIRDPQGRLREMFEPVVGMLGYELVGIEYLQGAGGLLRVYIDSEDGITLDDCSRVSHQLSGLLDVEDIIKGQYNLEVSSPGLDRPLFTAEHFQRFAGHEAKIRLSVPQNGRRNFQGTLCGVQDDVVLLEMDNKQVTVPLNMIDKANLVPELD